MPLIGEILGITYQDLSVCKSDRVLVHILRFSPLLKRGCCILRRRIFLPPQKTVCGRLSAAEEGVEGGTTSPNSSPRKNHSTSLQRKRLQRKIEPATKKNYLPPNCRRPPPNCRRPPLTAANCRRLPPTAANRRTLPPTREPQNAGKYSTLPLCTHLGK